MKYVGATNSFIRAPFMVEGIIIGLLSGLLSTLLVSGGYTLISNKLAESSITQTIGLNILNLGDLINEIVIVYLILGIGIGIIGSMVSMRRYLDV